MTSRQYCAWYGLGCTGNLETAEEAFKKAVSYYLDADRPSSKIKGQLGNINATTVFDLLRAVDDARQIYNCHRADSKMRRCIEQVSERVHHYGNVLDVFVQHHPEYVSLAWGTMKLLVGAVVEHRKTGSILANSLLDIADSLPRVNLTSSLYPTQSMQRMVATLYASIIRFLMRALIWYDEGSWKRALHSVTRPVDLQYDDILDDIQRVTASINAEATAGSRAEQRDMHHEIIEIRRAVELSSKTKDVQLGLKDILEKIAELKIDVKSGQVTAQSERAQISRSISTIQSTQALHIISLQGSIDHRSSLEASKNQRERRRSKILSPFWKSTDLERWNKSMASSIFILNVRLSERRSVQDFSTSVVQQLVQSQIAILWVLQTGDARYSLITTLRSLVSQAVVYIKSQNDEDLNRYAERLLHAQLEEHFVELLANILSSMKVVYLVIHMDAIGPTYASQLMHCLQQLLKNLLDLAASTIVRVLVVNWNPQINFGKPDSFDQSKSTVTRPSRGKKAQRHTRSRPARLRLGLST